MHKLAPTSLYRLRTLSTAGPRFYRVSVYMRRLETLGLVAATGRSDPTADSVEYTITDAGRAELEERYGSLSLVRDDG
jgi:DNA-binding PadR family transcriptional regulator